MLQDKLNKISKKTKLMALELCEKTHAGHIGSMLSCVDLMVYTFFQQMKDKDFFILSKGHAACGLYCILNLKGLISKQKLKSFYKDGTNLPAHPPACGIDGIPFATGSLGHGLSLACGLALGAKLKKSNQQIYCLLSDGECNEGSTWEAINFAAQNKLDNLTVFLDKNNLQAFGTTKEVMNMDNMKERWQSFYWDVKECDGHDFNSIHKAVSSFDKKSIRPKCVIANTIKGKGVSFMENKIEWHYFSMNEEQYNIAVREINKQ
ncbi:MAG: transketolase [Candidatus Gastranaerophilaceae bacterium]